jgi:diaminohydroxyphosphoribosylaminopyrimidine deaminase/5-amino-6-(5-phosphoribosylamino)uracil reductase
LLPETAPGRLDPAELLRRLGEREMSNVLVEGGAKLLGSLFDAGLVDRVMVFVAPRILAAAGGLGPIGGSMHKSMNDARALTEVCVETAGNDAIIQGWLTDIRDYSPDKEKNDKTA